MKSYGERLTEIKCDGCEATIAPRPDIAESGWMTSGTIDLATREKTHSDWCPSCWAERSGR